MKVVFASILTLISVCGTANGELIPNPSVERLSRQASNIVLGKVIDDLRVEVLEQYKGDIQARTVNVPEIAKWNERVRNQFEESYPEHIIQRSLFTEDKLEQLRLHGLVGQQVVLLLTKKDDEFQIIGKALNLKGNCPHAAIKVVIDEKLFGFSQEENPGPPTYLGQDKLQDLEALEAAIKYDHPLLVEFGYAEASGGGEKLAYFYFGVSNLTNEKIALNLVRDISLAVRAKGRSEYLLPNRFMQSEHKAAFLEPGECITDKYFLDYEALKILKISKGESFEASFAVGRGEWPGVIQKRSKGKISTNVTLE